MIPWCSSAVFFSATLGVPIWGEGGFAPYAVFPYVCPLIAFLLAWTGIGISRLSDEEASEALEELEREENEAFVEDPAS